MPERIKHLLIPVCSLGKPPGFLPAWMACLFLVQMLTAVSCPAESLVWATDDTPGGYYITGGGPEFHSERPGIEIELYRMVAEKVGLDLVLKRLPWKQCLYLIEQNRLDGIFPASFKPERMGIGAYPMAGGKVDESRKTRNNAYFLYQLKTGPAIWNGTAFSPERPVSVGVPEGWAIVETARKMFGRVQEETVNPKIPNLLIHRRLDGFICLETVFDAYLKREPAFADIVKTGPAIWEKPYYLMLSRQFAASRPQVAEEIWNSIREIRLSGDYQALVQKYIQTE